MKGKVLKAWCAAWIDTEGSIGLYGKNRHSLRIEIHQKDIRPLKIIRSYYGGTIHERKKDGILTGCHKLHVDSSKAYLFLKDAVPYLVVKREKAMHLIAIYEEFGKWTLSFLRKRKLNEYKNKVKSLLVMSS